MMSGVENNKDNKKPRSPKKSKNGSLRKTKSGSKLAKSPRYKVKKQESMLRTCEPQRSDMLLSMDFSEIDKDTKEEKTISARPSRSNLKIPKLLPPPEAPPTHFVPVVVQGVWSDFLNYSVVNRNMVFTKVGFSLMTKLMPGDQISAINGAQIWNKDSLVAYLEGINKPLLGKDPALMTVTVIRVWNVSCLTSEQIEKLVAPREEHLHYFSVKVYGLTEHEKGWKLVMDKKKRVLVQHIHADTPISSALIIGDQILGVNDNFFTAKSKHNLRQQTLHAIKSSVKKQGYAEIIGCRLVGARSSPAASIEAELAKKFPGYAIGVDKGTFCKMKRSEISALPLESDALEIAYRELSFLRQWEKKDENGNIDFELPPCEKGASLLIDAPSPGTTGPSTNPESGLTTPSSSNTTLSRTASSTSMNEKQEKSGTGSVYMPLTSSEMAPVAETPRKRKIFGKQAEPEMPQDIKFEDTKNETSKITSDIPEEDELKKCDARSGIVAYIKNKWSSH